MKKQDRHSGNLSPEMTLLGYLYGGPSHGYDLHRRVMADLGEVWHLSQSQAYSILKRLEKQGEISSEAVPQAKLPSRQNLHMTEKGRERFLAWLEATSGGSTRAIRMEFVTRLYFMQMYFPEKIAPAFLAQCMEASSQVQRLEKVRAGLPDDQLFNRMSLDMRLQQLKIVMQWLDEYQRYFQEN